jgi:hypothetical protein
MTIGRGGGGVRAAFRLIVAILAVAVFPSPAPANPPVSASATASASETSARDVRFEAVLAIAQVPPANPTEQAQFETLRQVMLAINLASSPPGTEPIEEWQRLVRAEPELKQAGRLLRTIKRKSRYRPVVEFFKDEVSTRLRVITKTRAGLKAIAKQYRTAEAGRQRGSAWSASASSTTPVMAPPATTPSIYAPPAASDYRCAENGSCYGDPSALTGRPKTVEVQGYYRKDGTYVRGHYRSHRR